jgi:hypothetical protein
LSEPGYLGRVSPAAVNDPCLAVGREKAYDASPDEKAWVLASGLGSAMPSVCLVRGASARENDDVSVSGDVSVNGGPGCVSVNGGPGCVSGFANVNDGGESGFGSSKRMKTTKTTTKKVYDDDVSYAWEEVVRTRPSRLFELTRLVSLQVAVRKIVTATSGEAGHW